MGAKPLPYVTPSAYVCKFCDLWSIFRLYIPALNRCTYFADIFHVSHEEQPWNGEGNKHTEEQKCTAHVYPIEVLDC